MAIREGKVLVMGVLIAMFLIIGNSTYLLVKSEDSVGMISGNSIKDVVSGFYETSSVNHRIFILFQFFLLVLIVIIVLIIIKRFKSKAKLSKRDFVEKNRTGSKTDLDILYEMLKREKEISIDDIGKIFNVSAGVSLEWSKVLEDGDLATIDYPRFGKPVLILMKEDEAGEMGSVEEKKVEEKKVEGEEVEEKKVEERKVEGEEVVPQKKIFKKEKKKIEKVPKKTKKETRKVSKKVKKK